MSESLLLLLLLLNAYLSIARVASNLTDVSFPI